MLAVDFFIIDDWVGYCRYRIPGGVLGATIDDVEREGGVQRGDVAVL